MTEDQRARVRRDTIGTFRNGTFFLRNSNSAGAPSVSFVLGNPGDVGIAGDWNGDGKDTTGVFRPSNGALYLKNTNATGFADIQINYGLPGDRPVTGDWDGDGDMDIVSGNTAGYIEKAYFATSEMLARQPLRNHQ